MKKLMFFILFLTISAIGYSQGIIYGDSLIIKGGGNFESNVQVPDPVNNLDAANKQWVLLQGNVSVDSSRWIISEGNLILYKAGFAIDTTNLDGRYTLLSSMVDYIMYGDTTDLIATHNYIEEYLATSGQFVFELNLPIAGTLAGSVALMVEGTDYPTGWSISASGVNLQVNHGLLKNAANVTVFYNTTGNAYRQLINFQSAYSGILNVDNENLTIEGISGYYTQYKLKIYIILR